MPNQTASPVPKNEDSRKAPEFLGLNWKVTVLATLVSIIALIFGLLQSLTSSQREQIQLLKLEVDKLSNEVSRLKIDLAANRASNEQIDQRVTLDIFRLRCALQGGVFDVAALTCQVGQIKDKFEPLPRGIKIRVSGWIDSKNAPRETLIDKVVDYNFTLPVEGKVTNFQLAISQVVNGEVCAVANIAPGALGFPEGTTMDTKTEIKERFEAGCQVTATGTMIQCFVDPKRPELCG